MYEAAIIAFLAVGLLLIKLRTRTILWLLSHQLAVDLIATGLFTWLLAGSYSGMMAALTAGVAFSIAWYILGKCVGHEEMHIVKCRVCNHRHKEWVRYPGWLSKQPGVSRRHSHRCKISTKFADLRA